MLHRLTAILGYLLAAIVVVLGTIALVAYGSGYSYNFTTHHLVRNGLVILQSTPSGGHLVIDGKAISQHTPYRRTFKAGVHDFTITEDGYRTWHKQIDVMPSGVSLAQYVILLPQHIGIEQLATFTHIVASVPSPDHHKLALTTTGGASDGVLVYDTGSKNQVKVFTPAAATDTVAAETVTSVVWSGDNSHLLIQTTNGQQTQWYLVTNNDSSPPVNLTDTFKTDFNALVFDPSNYRTLYWNSTDGLRRLDVTSGSISGVLVAHVASFDFASDRIMYVDDSKPVRSLWLLDRAGHRQMVAARVPEGQGYVFSYSSLLGTPEIALTAQPAGTTVIYHDILSDNPKVQAIPSTGDAISFNDDGHFLLVWSATSLTSYDIEWNLTNIFPLLRSTATNVSWFDNSHVLFDRAGQTVLSEFDGGNAVAITKASTTPAMGNYDGKSVLVVGITSTGASQLKTVKIRQ